MEDWDAGYGSYVGFMIVDKTHSHPIAISFINLLLDITRKHKLQGIANNPARDNWHLAYTLIHNNQIRFLRKHAIDKKNESLKKDDATML